MTITVASADEPSATPYRPTVSNPAALPAQGLPEIELGVLHSQGGENKRHGGLPFFGKYASNNNWGVLIGNDLYTHATSINNLTSSGFGDITLILKHHYALSESLALGLEAGVKPPIASGELGRGKFDQMPNGISLGDVGMDINRHYALRGR